MFKFKPIFKELIWGGHDILPFKGLPADSRKIGESWEMSGVEGSKSIVSENYYGTDVINDCRKTIDELIAAYGEKLLGKNVMDKTGTTFPLLIKFIDAQDDLSIQVHPNDELAMQRHHSYGKTEMWYVVDAKPDACLYTGFSRQITPEEYVKRVENNTIMEVLQRYEVKVGDVFFLPAGRIHAIGKGCFIAEIQQASNITYRIYDYDRKDANGNRRELHTELAKNAIDYTIYPDYKTRYTTNTDGSVELVSCKYFTTKLYNIKNRHTTFLNVDSFIIYICLEGEAKLFVNKGGFRMKIRQGEVALIPAEASSITVDAGDASVKLLETHVR
jgi:mannose-6-phosphate isomerase